MSRIIELIYNEQRTGLGTDKDPVRMISELWTKDGELVATKDSIKLYEEFNPEIIKQK